MVRGECDIGRMSDCVREPKCYLLRQTQYFRSGLKLIKTNKKASMLFRKMEIVFRRIGLKKSKVITSGDWVRKSKRLLLFLTGF